MTENTQPKLQVLLIDDDAIFLKVNKLLLTKKFLNIEVKTAINLKEIEELMEDDFDLVLIDLNMPEITGWDLIERYQKKLQQNEVHALICSSSLDKKDYERAQELHGTIDKMICKPIDLESIKEYLGPSNIRSQAS